MPGVSRKGVKNKAGDFPTSSPTPQTYQYINVKFGYFDAICISLHLFTQHLICIGCPFTQNYRSLSRTHGNVGDFMMFG